MSKRDGSFWTLLILLILLTVLTFWYFVLNYFSPNFFIASFTSLTPIISNLKFSFKPFFPPFRQYRHGAGTRPEKPSNAFKENVLCRRRTRLYAGLWRVAPAFLRPCGSVSKHVTSSQAASGRAADPFTAGALPGRRVREGFPPFADNTKEP